MGKHGFTNHNGVNTCSSHYMCTREDSSELTYCSNIGSFMAAKYYIILMYFKTKLLLPSNLRTDGYL